jgi:hypothetical protein
VNTDALTVEEAEAEILRVLSASDDQKK